MDIEKFRSAVMNPRTRTYCVLDAAAVPNLPRKLYEFDPPNYPLIRGELTPDMVHVVPYLALMIPNEKFTSWVLENAFGKNWGIIVQSRFSIYEMRRHFRSLIQVVDEQGKAMLFRFYDPRVIRKFLPTCDAEQLKAFFGNTEAYYAEAEDGDVLLSYTNSDGELTTREIDLAEKAS